MRVCRAMASQQISATICPWNAPGESPRRVCDMYLAAARALGSAGIDGYLSIKAPALGFSSELLAEIVEAARTAGVAIHFDSLAPEAAEPTWDLIASTRDRCSRLGCTLPARWRRSALDVGRALELGLAVRIVKGQWPDSEPNNGDIPGQFDHLVRLLAGRARHVAVATHDHVLAGRTLSHLQRTGTSCELELLLGLPRRLTMNVARHHGVGIRLYVPYGRATLPYDIGEVRTNRRIAWWAARDWLVSWL